MKNFFDGVAPDNAVAMEAMSRLMFELRRNRDQLLEHWGVTDTPALLARISNGEIDEHPAYEAWLAACILEDTHATVRSDLKQCLAQETHSQ